MEDGAFVGFHDPVASEPVAQELIVDPALTAYSVLSATHDPLCHRKRECHFTDFVAAETFCS